MQEIARFETPTGTFDWLGAVVGAIAIGGLAFGATRGQQREWQDSLAWASLARRRRRPRDLPDPHGPPAAPARPARAVPEPRVRGDQPLDVPDLRRAVRRRVLPVGPAPGDARLHGDGGVAVRASRPASSSSSCRPRVGALAGRHRPEAVPRRRAADHGRGPAVVGSDPGDLGAVAGVARRPRHARPAALGPHRRPAGAACLRARDRARRRAPDEHADGLDPDAATRASARRSTTPSRGSARRSSGP